MNVNNHSNPWKGLNFYEEGEVIYGRDQEITNLSYYIFNNTQTILYGRSGIGKSSILNAGIFPKARKAGMIPITIRLKHNREESYITQIKNELESSGITLMEQKKVIDGKHETLWEFFHRHRFVSSSTREEVVPLIVFDQFEEIFTLQTDERVRRDFFNGLADLFNDVKPLAIIEHENKDLSQSVLKTTKSIDKGDFKGLNISLNLKGAGKNKSNNEEGYVDMPLYHIVFAIREDFLSSLEIYTFSIPVMRNNRFALMPINEEQAAEIIANPIPGLVDLDVAKRIIEKVTGTKKFHLDGIPEIEVDSAILSLYLSRLYDQMKKLGKSIIDTELVETYSKDIIEDYYCDAIKGLSDKSIEWIEDILVNEEGRRDNRDKISVLKESGLSENELIRLIYESKLLRQFSYGGGLRIEFIHDIITPVVVQHRNNRALIKHQQKTKRRNIFLLSLVMILLVALISYIIVSDNQRQQTIGSMMYTVALLEDSTLNKSDDWIARMVIINKSDTLLVDTLSRINPVTSFQSLSTLKEFPDINLYFMDSDIRVDTIYHDPNNDYQINIRLTQNGNRKRINGKVVSNLVSGVPINDAVVIIDDNYTETNFKGEFELYIDEDFTDDRIRIVKAGYEVYDGELSKKGHYKLKYANEMKFYDEAKILEQKVLSSHKKYSLSGRIYAISNDKVVSGDATMHLGVMGDEIFGYAYYLKSYAQCKSYDAYFLINGYLDPQSKSFRMKWVDAVGNTVVYTGHKEGDVWDGEAYDKKDRKKKVSYFSLS